MMLKVAVFNFKGGTGKSTTALNLGAALATRNRQVLLIDLDGQRTLSFGLGLDGHEPTTLDWLMEPQAITPYSTVVNYLSLIPGDLGMFRLSADADLFTPALAELKPFDLVLMDCPPGLGLASVQAILSCDRILIPTLCEPASLKGLAEAVSLIREDRTEIPIDVLRSRYKPRLRLTQDADELLKDAAAELDYQLLQTVIPENIAIAEAIAQQQSVLNYAPKSSGTQAFKTLAKECSKLWETP
jgi:chromosome partitioning protein